MIRFDFISVLIFVGIFQALFLATALVVKKSDRLVSNRILAVFLLILAAVQGFVYLYRSTQIISVPHLMRTEIPLLLLLGPTLLVYVESMTSRDFNLRLKKRLPHLLPAIGYAAYLTPFYLQHAEGKISTYYSAAIANPGIWDLDISVAMIHLLVYVVLVARGLIQHKRNLELYFSSLAGINLNWIRNLLIGIGLVWMAMTVHYTYPMPFCNVVFSSMITSLVFYVGFKGLTQPEIFSAEHNALATSKYTTSALTPEMAENLVAKLQDFMASKKPHLDYLCTLPKLAKQLAVSPHHLSQVLNELHQQNFFGFINQHRIEVATKLLADPSKRHFTIAGIASEAGFNSVSAFNAAFKRQTGVTPSQFKKQATA
ncbi:MAG: helix-turn-helix domain-containing protein [Calditrichaeota bacterium]|nr:helix-turn-helix domain-containing protein [Calditrichota bacterium]